MMPESKTYLADCMNPETGLPSFPDKYFDLAVVDPPYGIKEGNKKSHGSRRGQVKYTNYPAGKKWDNIRPDQKYFDELFRVSKNQIIWGANNFTDYLPPSTGWIFWDKDFSDEFSFSAGELAFTSFPTALKKFWCKRSEWMNCVSNNAQEAVKFAKTHPTQKPIALYDWIYKRYAQPGMKVLDTHLGSGSNRISAYKAGMDFTAFELDPDYFAAQEERFRKFLIEYGTPDISQAIKGQQINLF